MQNPWIKPPGRSLLRLAAGLYGLGVGLRLRLYRWHLLPSLRLPLKVISLGNLTAGGSGKTPHTALLARYLQKKGIKVAVLSRGYGGTKMKSGAVISDGRSLVGTLEEGGEEPFWLAQKLPGIPVLVGKDRYRSGMTCVRFWQTDWVVLDDGFQHLRLKRDLNILLVPAHRRVDSERLLPLGLLREPTGEMKRADMILLTHAERLDPGRRTALAEKIQSLVPGVPFFFSEHKPAVIWSYPSKKILSSALLAGRRLLAFCGLAEPESFLFSLKQLGVDPVELVAFRDHHDYQEKDKRTLEDRGRALKVNGLITTEKDVLKLGKWEAPGLELLVLGIEVEILDSTFWETIDRRLEGPLSV
jgi:tetraacyldisaccharide 4'-kinase